MKPCLIVLIFLFLSSWHFALSQDSPVDSLEAKLTLSKGAERFDLLYELSKFTSKTDPKSSLAYAEEAHALAVKLDDPERISNALNALAIDYYYLGNNYASLKYIKQSIDQMKTIRAKDTSNLELLNRLAIISSNAGNIYQQLGELDSAQGMFLQSSGFLEQLMALHPRERKYITSYIHCLNNTAVNYQELQKTEKAEQLLNDALKRSRELNYLPGIAMSLNNLGLMEIRRKNFPNAQKIYLEALEINHKLNDSIAIAGTLNNLGLIQEETGMNRKALEYYKTSLRISKRLNNLFGVSNTSTNIGKIYIRIQQFDSAQVYLVSGLSAARSGGMLQLQQQSLKELSNMYRSAKQWEKAFETYQEYTLVKDSIFNLERTKQIEEMEAKYETEKKERENELLRKDIALHKTTQRLLIVAVSALILLALLIFFLLRFKNRLLHQKTILLEQEQRMQKLEIEKKEIERKHFEDQVFAEQEINRLQLLKLEEQNRKLAATAIQITSKNKIFSDIFEEIEQIKRSNHLSPEECLKKIQQTIKSNLNFDKDWEQFKLHFEEVHPDFFIRLNQQFPGLTAGEHKLCAYYRINLSTNEIAQILNNTIAAVQKSRHRLRKKMGIDSETEMTEYMRRF